MTITDTHLFREPEMPVLAVTIARGPSGTVREQATAHILSLYQRGGMTDEDLCEAYNRNCHYFSDWPALTDAAIIHLRNELSSHLKLTAYITRGHFIHALTDNLR